MRSRGSAWESVAGRLGVDARHIARGRVDVDARDLHLRVPPIGQVLPAHERGVQTPERAAVLIGQGGGGVERIERGYPVGIEGVADRAAAALALDGGDDMGVVRDRPEVALGTIAEVDDGLFDGHGLSPL